jgi:predicted ATP-dependent serine protease
MLGQSLTVYSCIGCGYAQQRPGRCPYCNNTMIVDEYPVQDRELTLAERVRRYYDSHL